MNPIDNVWNIMKKEIGNQIPCKIKKKRCGSEHVKRGIVQHMEELYSLMPRRTADLFKQREVQQNTDFIM